jgi:hypothetical protein
VGIDGSENEATVHHSSTGMLRKDEELKSTCSPARSRGAPLAFAAGD